MEDDMTLYLDSCRDMCQNLKRELDRLESSTSREDISDHAIS